jgi:hypothetical protein
MKTATQEALQKVAGAVGIDGGQHLCTTLESVLTDAQTSSSLSLQGREKAGLERARAAARTAWTISTSSTPRSRSAWDSARCRWDKSQVLSAPQAWPEIYRNANLFNLKTTAEINDFPAALRPSAAPHLLMVVFR